jgi:hypothetical protein
VVTCIESANEYKEIPLRVFLDIEGAFDRTSFEVITQAAERHGIESTICRWICSMLESRNIVTTLLGETSRVSMTQGCPQEGVLSPLLWSVVVDELLWELNDNDYYTVGYADDIAILSTENSFRLCQRSYKQHYAQSSSSVKGQSRP